MGKRPGPVEARIDGLLAATPPDRDVELDVSGVRIVVRTNSGSLASQLRSYYASFAAAPALPFIDSDLEIAVLEANEPSLGVRLREQPAEPGKHRVKEAVAELPDGRIVRKLRTGMQFLLAGRRYVAVGPATTHLNQVVNFVNNLYIGIRLSQGCLLGHAAGLVFEERGVAIAGKAGAGKSTMALRLMNRGATFVSNDRLMLHCDGAMARMLGVPKYPRVNPGTVLGNPRLHHLLDDRVRERLNALSDDALWWLEDKLDVPVEEIYGVARFKLEAKLDLLMVMTWSLDGECPCRVEFASPERRRTLIGHLMKNPGLFASHLLPVSASDRPEEGRYDEVLRGVPILEASGRIDFERAAEAVRSHCVAVDGPSLPPADPLL